MSAWREIGHAGVKTAAMLRGCAHHTFSTGQNATGNHLRLNLVIVLNASAWIDSDTIQLQTFAFRIAMQRSLTLDTIPDSALTRDYTRFIGSRRRRRLQACLPGLFDSFLNYKILTIYSTRSQALQDCQVLCPGLRFFFSEVKKLQLRHVQVFAFRWSVPGGISMTAYFIIVKTRVVWI